jgi:ATP-dependent DNA helicase RecG
VPIYPLTQGIGAKWLRHLVKRAADYWSKRLPDHIPAQIRKDEGLLDLETAIAQIHFPDSKASLNKARHRLAFDELFVVQIGLLRQRHEWRSQPGKPLAVDDDALHAFVGSLPYALTAAQNKALNQIVKDLGSEQPMNRL